MIGSAGGASSRTPRNRRARVVYRRDTEPSGRLRPQRAMRLLLLRCCTRHQSVPGLARRRTTVPYDLRGLLHRQERSAQASTDGGRAQECRWCWLMTAESGFRLPLHGLVRSAVVGCGFAGQSGHGARGVASHTYEVGVQLCDHLITSPREASVAVHQAGVERSIDGQRRPWSGPVAVTVAVRTYERDQPEPGLVIGNFGAICGPPE